MKICILYLTCENDRQAEKISDKLLTEKLIFCAKRFAVKSSFLWNGKTDKSEEVMLVMDSIEENFEKVKTIVAKLHSYDTFVLFSTPVTKTTPQAEEWIKKEIKQ